MASLIAALIVACVVVVCAAETPSYVRVKLLDFEYTGPACDPFGNKCDPKFKLTYAWQGQTEAQEIGEQDSHSVNFSGVQPKVFTGPYEAGSVVSVVVEVVDVDYDWNDHMATLRFAYVVPQVPTADETITVVDGKSTMRIEFRTIFM